MNFLPGYDTWKTSPPEEQGPKVCYECGEYLFGEYERYYTDYFCCDCYTAIKGGP